MILSLALFFTIVLPAPSSSMEEMEIATWESNVKNILFNECMNEFQSCNTQISYARKIENKQLS